MNWIALTSIDIDIEMLKLFNIVREIFFKTKSFSSTNFAFFDENFRTRKIFSDKQKF